MMRLYRYDSEIIIHLFQVSLEGLASERFNTLDSNSLLNCNNIIDLYQIKFKNQVEWIPELSDIQGEVTKSNEDFINIYTCWCDLYAKSAINLFKEQCAKQIIKSSDHKIRGW